MSYLHNIGRHLFRNVELIFGDDDSIFVNFLSRRMVYHHDVHDNGILNMAIMTSCSGREKMDKKRHLRGFLRLCMALYELEVPDLQLYMIFDEMYEDNGLTDYQKWLVTRMVKRQYTPIGPNVRLYKRINLRFKKGFLEELFRRYFVRVDGVNVGKRLLIKN
jgi:hypothetical protein